MPYLCDQQPLLWVHWEVRSHLRSLQFLMAGSIQELPVQTLSGHDASTNKASVCLTYVRLMVRQWSTLIFNANTRLGWGMWLCFKMRWLFFLRGVDIIEDERVIFRGLSISYSRGYWLQKAIHTPHLPGSYARDQTMSKKAFVPLRSLEPIVDGKIPPFLSIWHSASWSERAQVFFIFIALSCIIERGDCATLRRTLF